MAGPTQKTDRFLHQTVPPLATYITNLHYTGASAKTVVVPDKAAVALFSTTALPFYVSTTGTAAVPTGDVTDGTGVAVSPTMRQVWNGDSFSVYCPAACEFSIEWYQVG